MHVVIVGARERRDSDADKQKVEEIILEAKKKYSFRLLVVSVGCDKGIGKYTREFCVKNSISFVENRMKLEGNNIERTDFAHVFQARNQALLALGDEFSVFMGPNETGIIEGLIEPAKARVGESRVTVYKD